MAVINEHTWQLPAHRHREVTWFAYVFHENTWTEIHEAQPV